MSILKEKQVSSFETLSKEFGIKNRLAAPRIQKVTINVGIGSAMKRDRNRKDFVIDRLSKITGQRPSVRGSKQSIASFKVRAGDPVGVAVTLRGTRMWSFLDKLVHVALPRTKDFRGLQRTSVDKLGNLNLGIKEHTIFPETSDEEISSVFGMSIVVTTTAETRPVALSFFTHLGFPLKAEDEIKRKALRKRGK
jgi:large subunit ribosomal protein L5